MNDLQASHLIDQIGAAYVDPAPEATPVFESLEDYALHHMTDVQWQKLHHTLAALHLEQLHHSGQ